MPTIAELFQLAARHHQGGNLAQAEPLYRQVLQADPANALANYMLGLLAHQSGHHEAALTLLRQALTLKPDLPGAYFNLGVVLMSLQRFSEAADFLRRSLATDPHQVEAYINLGNAYMNLGQFLDASKCYREALHINPQHPHASKNLGNALNNLGITLQTEGKLHEATDCYRQALAISPVRTDVLNNLGSIFHEQGRLKDASECYRQALQLQPQVANTHNNLGLVYRDQARFAAAAECFEKALQIDPSHKLALWNRCLSRLRHGDFEQGWPDFELRWAQPAMVPRSFDKPRWDGSPLRGKTILVYAEHGLGDTIQFMRYLPLVQHLVGKVIFECQVALFGLLSNIKGIDLLIPAGMPLPLFDVHVSLLSLPSFFLQPHAFIPNEIPYLVADPKRVEHWRRNLQSMPGFKVGISWQGSLNQKNDCRSIPLAEFMPLGWLENCHLISLQVGAGTDQLRSWAGSYPIVEISDRLGAVRDIQDSAAIIKNMDLVVTIDSAVAHLAGALGVPVWVVLPLVPCWRWLIDRPDSPWYHTMHLFRQNKPGDWQEVFERIAAEIRMFSPGSQNRTDSAPASIPNQAESYIQQGNAHLKQGSPDQAAASYREAVRANPRHSYAHNNLGLATLRQGFFDEAKSCFREAILLDPTNSHALFNLGNVLKDQDLMTEAAACYRQALEISPADAAGHNNLGIALQYLGQLEEAVACFRQSIRLSPSNGNVHVNLGIAFQELGKLREATECFENALRLDAGNRTALWNRALLRLLQGNFVKGWPDFEQRAALPGKIPRAFQQPRWDGSQLDGKTILVYAERGLGDSIQFARFLPMVQRRGGEVLLECQPALVDLLAGIPGVRQVVAAGAPIPPFDVQIPLLSLPGLLGTTLATVPADIPYLEVDPRRVAYWQGEIRQAAQRTPNRSDAEAALHVGISWQGSKSHKGDRRSFLLDHFRGLATAQGIQLFSLQVGPATEQLVSASISVTDLGSRFDPNSLVDLAAALLNLDLVVTVDSAVAHLAGALGRPVWVPLVIGSDWRWLLERTDSPWYPTMRLFRQRRWNDWDEVFARIAAELRLFSLGSQNRGRSAPE